MIICTLDGQIAGLHQTHQLQIKNGNSLSSSHYIIKSFSVLFWTHRVISNSNNFHTNKFFITDIFWLVMTVNVGEKELTLSLIHI